MRSLTDGSMALTKCQYEREARRAQGAGGSSSVLASRKPLPMTSVTRFSASAACAVAINNTAMKMRGAFRNMPCAPKAQAHAYNFAHLHPKRRS